MFDAEDTLAGCLTVMRSVVDGLTLNRERAGRAASGLLLATDVADYLVGRGVPFRRAHEIVGALVRKLVAEGREFSSLTLEEWRAVSELFCRRYRRSRDAGRVGGRQTDAAVDSTLGRAGDAGRCGPVGGARSPLVGAVLPRPNRLC